MHNVGNIYLIFTQDEGTHDDMLVATRCSCVGCSFANGVRLITAELAKMVYLSQSTLLPTVVMEGYVPGWRANINLNGSRASTLNLQAVQGVRSASRCLPCEEQLWLHAPKTAGKGDYKAPDGKRVALHTHQTHNSIWATTRSS